MTTFILYLSTQKRSPLLLPEIHIKQVMKKHPPRTDQFPPPSEQGRKRPRRKQMGQGIHPHCTEDWLPAADTNTGTYSLTPVGQTELGGLLPHYFIVGRVRTRSCSQQAMVILLRYSQVLLLHSKSST